MDILCGVPEIASGSADDRCANGSVWNFRSLPASRTGEYSFIGRIGEFDAGIQTATDLHYTSWTVNRNNIGAQ